MRTNRSKSSLPGSGPRPPRGPSSPRPSTHHEALRWVPYSRTKIPTVLASGSGSGWSGSPRPDRRRTAPRSRGAWSSWGAPLYRDGPPARGGAPSGPRRSNSQTRYLARRPTEPEPLADDGVGWRRIRLEGGEPEEIGTLQRGTGQHGVEPLRQAPASRAIRARHNVRMAYTHGHHESVLRSHTWRTAENSCAYLLPELRPGQGLLDVGCGPGTITADLALLVAPGGVVGLDALGGGGGPSRDAHGRARAGQPPLRGGRSPRARLPGRELRRGPRAPGSPAPDRPAGGADRAPTGAAPRRRARGPRRRLRRSRGLPPTRCSTAGSSCTSPSPPTTATTTVSVGASSSGAPGRVQRGRRVLVHLDLRRRRDPGLVGRPVGRPGAPLAICRAGHGLRIERTAELEEIAAAFTRWAGAPDGVFFVPHVEILARG